MSLEPGTIRQEISALVRRQAARLYGIAFLFLALPGAILQAIAPATLPGRLPEPGLWLLFLPVAPAASLLGALALCRLALRPGETARTALRDALGRLLPLLGAALLLGLAGLLLVGAGLLLVMALASPLPLLLPLALCLFCWIRLLLLTPIAAVEPLGPIALILRAWRVGAGHFWRLLALLLVAAILSLAGLIAAGLVGGIAVRLASGQPQPAMLPFLLVLLVSALWQAVVAGLLTIVLARLYARLAERAPAV
jgi:hypothetical protein